MSPVVSTALSQQPPVIGAQPASVSNPTSAVAHRAISQRPRSDECKGLSLLVAMVVFGSIAALLYFYAAITLGVIFSLCMVAGAATE